MNNLWKAMQETKSSGCSCAEELGLMGSGVQGRQFLTVLWDYLFKKLNLERKTALNNQVGVQWGK